VGDKDVVLILNQGLSFGTNQDSFLFCSDELDDCDIVQIYLIGFWASCRRRRIDLRAGHWQPNSTSGTGGLLTILQAPLVGKLIGARGRLLWTSASSLVCSDQFPAYLRALE
jgi:hypothetical protein